MVLNTLRTIDEVAYGLKKLIESRRLDVTSEKRTQVEIESLLKNEGWDFIREARISIEDIPDFIIKPYGLVVEVKIKGAQKMEVYRQLERYAAHDEILGVMLVTNLSMGLPATINGKPTFYASLTEI
jgi:hypothetical protein